MYYYLKQPRRKRGETHLFFVQFQPFQLIWVRPVKHLACVVCGQRRRDRHRRRGGDFDVKRQRKETPKKKTCGRFMVDSEPAEVDPSLSTRKCNTKY